MLGFHGSNPIQVLDADFRLDETIFANIFFCWNPKILSKKALRILFRHFCFFTFLVISAFENGNLQMNQRQSHAIPPLMMQCDVFTSLVVWLPRSRWGQARFAFSNNIVKSRAKCRMIEAFHLIYCFVLHSASNWRFIGFLPFAKFTTENGELEFSSRLIKGNAITRSLERPSNHSIKPPDVDFRWR